VTVIVIVCGDGVALETDAALNVRLPGEIENAGLLTPPPPPPPPPQAASSNIADTTKKRLTTAAKTDIGGVSLFGTMILRQTSTPGF